MMIIFELYGMEPQPNQEPQVERQLFVQRPLLSFSWPSASGSLEEYYLVENRNPQKSDEQWHLVPLYTEEDIQNYLPKLASLTTSDLEVIRNMFEINAKDVGANVGFSETINNIAQNNRNLGHYIMRVRKQAIIDLAENKSTDFANPLLNTVKVGNKWYKILNLSEIFNVSRGQPLEIASMESQMKNMREQLIQKNSRVYMIIVPINRNGVIKRFIMLKKDTNIGRYTIPIHSPRTSPTDLLRKLGFPNPAGLMREEEARDVYEVIRLNRNASERDRYIQEYYNTHGKNVDNFKFIFVPIEDIQGLIEGREATTTVQKGPLVGQPTFGSDANGIFINTRYGRVTLAPIVLPTVNFLFQNVLQENARRYAPPTPTPATQPAQANDQRRAWFTGDEINFAAYGISRANAEILQKRLKDFKAIKNPKRTNTARPGAYTRQEFGFAGAILQLTHNNYNDWLRALQDVFDPVRAQKLLDDIISFTNPEDPDNTNIDSD